MYTVKKLAGLAGVTARALRYYDALGLLKPTSVGGNRYRYYGEEALLRLQQILFYRELELPLAEIGKIMRRRDFDLVKALEGHKAELGRRIARLERLRATVDETISHLRGEKTMSTGQLFAAFSEAEQEKMAAEAERLYDAETVRASNRRWKSYSAAEKQRILDQGNRIYADMIEAMPAGPASDEVQAVVERWRRHMDWFWTPALGQLLPLARHYAEEPRFKANFDRMKPGLAEFMGRAVEEYVKRAAK